MNHLEYREKLPEGPCCCPLMHSFLTFSNLLCIRIQWMRKNWLHPRFQGWRIWHNCATRAFYAFCHSKPQVYYCWECWDQGICSCPKWCGMRIQIWKLLKLVSSPTTGEQSQENCREMELEPWWPYEYYSQSIPKACPSSRLFNDMNQ